MNLSNARATIGLQAKATPTSTNVIGSVQIGANPATVTFPDADVAYSLNAFFAASTTLDLDMTDGDTTGSTAWVAGTQQVETATAVGTITGSGNASVVVTAAGMSGSPKTINVPVLNGDTAAVWAGKVRTALAADSAVSALFTVSGTSTAIILTRKPIETLTSGGISVPIRAANDGTLNISLDNGTCTGITTAATSANTTAGVATDGVLIYDGDGKDFEGVTIPTIDVKGYLLEYVAFDSTLDIAGDDHEVSKMKSKDFISQYKCLFPSTDPPDETIFSFAPSDPSILTITVIGETA